MKTLVLVCNSHIDPVWLWPWEEGLAETLATFRSAAALCDEFDGFAFCHNEALLYRWVEEFEPPLFERIRDLVRRGRWHVIGGFYLQPDANLPSGESIVRQIAAGKRYFLETFGVEPTVATSFDSFGHTRGLVQILRKSGYRGYLFCRPDRRHLELPSDDFVWVGHDGSTVLAHRASEHYNSARGQARAKVEGWLERHGGEARGLVLWGVGNHGGGPSREDLEGLAALMAAREDRAIRHGRPEDYFALLAEDEARLPRVASALAPWAVGCYTSMSTVKRAHRRLEGALYSAEKMLAGAAVQGLLPYPHDELRRALEDLLFCEFHDILPGSCVADVESQALHRLGHGLDLVSRLQARAFFAFLGGEAPATEGEFPIFVFNPHPFAVEDVIACEFQPPEPNADRRVFLEPALTDTLGRPVSHQLEKESCNIQTDQRKRLVFRTRLAASSMTRLSCRLHRVPRREAAEARPVTGPFTLSTDAYEIEIDGRTGLVARYAVGGEDLLLPGALRALVMKDSADPWGMKVRSFREQIGEFRLMAPAAAAAFAGVGRAELPPVRVIEDGEVRRVVEALFDYGLSALCLRYIFPSHGTEVEIDARVSWAEKDRMLKLAVPTRFADGRVRGETAYGVDEFPPDGNEQVAQKWVAITSADGRFALTVVNDATYGFSVAGGELRLSLLRSPAYAGHPVDDVTPIVRQDRFEPRLDQGAHRFRFWLNAGDAVSRLAGVGREATVRNEPPTALSVCPPGGGAKPVPSVTLSDSSVQLGAMTLSEDGERLVLRLFEPTGLPRTTTVTIPPLGVRFDASLGAFEIKTVAVDLHSGAVVETDLLERPGGG